MARLPSVTDLGGSPAIAAERPVATYDATPIAKGAEAIASSMAQFGKVVENDAEAVADLQEKRQTLAGTLSKANMLAGLEGKAEEYRHRTDYQAFPQQWASDAQAIVDDNTAGMPDGPIKQRLLAEMRVHLASQGAKIGEQAFAAHKDEFNAGVLADKNDITDKMKVDPNDPLHNDRIKTHQAMIDEGVRNGFMTKVEGEAARQSAGLAVADRDMGLVATTDPKRLLRETPGGLPRSMQELPSYWGREAAGRAAGVDQNLMAVVKRASEISGVQFVIGAQGGTRNQDEQDKLVAAGRSQTHNSNHLTGSAIDLIPIVDGKPNPDAAPKHYAEVSRAMKQASQELGVDVGWGGDWKSFKDDAHFELAGGAKKPTEMNPLWAKLSPEKVFAWRTHAMTIINRDQTNGRAAFQSSVADDLAAATRVGVLPDQTKTADEFMANYGLEEGQRRHQDYLENLQLGVDIHAMGAMSAEDRQTLEASYTPKPGEGYAAGAQRQDALIAADKAITARETAIATANEKLANELKADPASFTVKRAPAVSDAWGKLQDAIRGGSAIDPAAAARDYAVKTIMEQQRQGLAPDQMNLVPKSYIADLAKAVAHPEVEGGSAQVAKRLNAEQQLWGPDLWPQVFKQLSAEKSLPAVVRVVPGMAEVPARKLIELSGMGVKEILKDEHEERARDISNGVLDAMRPFKRSLTGASDELAVFNDFRGQAEKLAASYVADGKTASDAAAQAFKDVLGRYDFIDGGFGRDSFRVPKTRDDGGAQPFTTAEIEDGAAQAKANLGKVMFDRSNLDAADKAMGLTPQERALYERHLTNLVGTGGVDNPDGSRSTLFQTTVEHAGKFYAIPTVWDGKILWNKGSEDPAAEAVKRVQQVGWDKFPSYASEDEAEARYGKMHDYMEKDTGQHFKGKAGLNLDVIPPAVAQGFAQKYLGAAPINTYRRDAVWATASGDVGLRLVYDGETVRTRDGKPLVLTWDQLAGIARGGRMNVTAPPPASTGGT